MKEHSVGFTLLAGQYNEPHSLRHRKLGSGAAMPFELQRLEWSFAKKLGESPERGAYVYLTRMLPKGPRYQLRARSVHFIHLQQEIPS
jgi:hypothetical protein